MHHMAAAPSRAYYTPRTLVQEIALVEEAKAQRCAAVQSLSLAQARIGIDAHGGGY